VNDFLDYCRDEECIYWPRNQDHFWQGTLVIGLVLLVLTFEGWCFLDKYFLKKWFNFWTDRCILCFNNQESNPLDTYWPHCPFKVNWVEWLSIVHPSPVSLSPRIVQGGFKVVIIWQLIDRGISKLSFPTPGAGRIQARILDRINPMDYRCQQLLQMVCVSNGYCKSKRTALSGCFPNFITVCISLVQFWSSPTMKSLELTHSVVFSCQRQFCTNSLAGLTV